MREERVFNPTWALPVRAIDRIELARDASDPRRPISKHSEYGRRPTGLLPSLRLQVFDDVTLEDEATNMKAEYTLELSQTELTLCAARTRRSACGAVRIDPA
jgi:hypothetical protein